jgi:hypothetical protein
MSCQQRCPDFTRTKPPELLGIGRCPRDSGVDASGTTIEGTKFIADSYIQSQCFRRINNGVQARDRVQGHRTSRTGDTVLYLRNLTSVTRLCISLRSGYAFRSAHEFPPLVSPMPTTLFRCTYRLLGCCLVHSSERPGAFDCLPLF